MAELKQVRPTKTADEDDVLLDMENQNGSESTKAAVGLYFSEGGYKIDYVLVYERNPELEERDDNHAAIVEEHEEKRKAFEEALKNEGLMIEREMVVSPQVSWS